MRMWSFYSKETGLFTGARFGTTDLQQLEANTPKGCSAAEGQHDHLSRRIDVATGKIVDWQPPAPDNDHEWDDEGRRWLLKPAVLERAARQQKIESLEARQARPFRELMLNPDNEMAKERIEAIDREIAMLRG